MGSRLREHRWLLVALAAGLLVRAGTLAAFPPAFVFSDGPTYLDLSTDLAPSPDRTVGYAAWLALWHLLDDGVWLTALVQHGLGLLTAVVLHALLRRRGCSDAVATLGVLPVLLDGMQLSLEHSVLSDVLFSLLVVLAVALLGWWHAPPAWTCAAAGLVLGSAVLVRVGGGPVVLGAVLLVAVAARGWRARAAGVALVVVGFAAPLLAYAAWYHAEEDRWALTESGGRALYMRTTTFLDCSLLDLPDYQAKLCPTEPVGERLDPTYYGWHAPARFEPPFPPAGTTLEESMGDLARQAIAAQPGDYARVVARDVALTFDWTRGDRVEYDTAYKWRFSGWYGYQPTDWTGPAYAAFGGTPPTTEDPWASAMVLYGRVVYLWGPLLLVLLVGAVAGLVAPRPAGDASRRALGLTLVALGTGLVLVPDATAQFTWRYVLPMVVLVPPAAALAWSRLRGRPDPAAARGAQPGTRATPSTDWPNGGTTRRSSRRVVGTTNRS